MCVCVRFRNYILIYEKCFQPHILPFIPPPHALLLFGVALLKIMRSSKHIRTLAIEGRSFFHRHRITIEPYNTLKRSSSNSSSIVCREKLMRVVFSSLNRRSSELSVKKLRKKTQRSSKKIKLKTHINKINVHEQHLFSTFNVFRILRRCESV
jgi:hypothetical protein